MEKHSTVTELSAKTSDAQQPPDIAAHAGEVDVRRDPQFRWLLQRAASTAPSPMTGTRPRQLPDPGGPPQKGVVISLIGLSSARCRRHGRSVRRNGTSRSVPTSGLGRVHPVVDDADPVARVTEISSSEVAPLGLGDTEVGAVPARRGTVDRRCGSCCGA